jgi:hypothetical protein
VVCPVNTRHFWSPRLNLELETTENGGTRIEGNYGPNANVWGPFLYGYLLTGTFGLFAGVFGFAQCLVGQQPWALWIFGAMLATGIGLYVGAQFGQKLCDEEQFHKSSVKPDHGYPNPRDFSQSPARTSRGNPGTMMNAGACLRK